MKVVSTDALTKLIQLVKSAFISVDNTVETSEVDSEVIVGWGIPDYSAEVVLAWDTAEILPCDALVVVRSNVAANAQLYLEIDGVNYGGVGNGGSSGGFVEVVRVVSKGSTVKAKGGSTQADSSAYYCPLKGVN